jgi:N-acetyl-gamma-glutamyl-phosphate reductase
MNGPERSGDGPPSLYEVALCCIIVHMGVSVAIAGASGYAGGEVLRLLAAHPGLDVVAATAHANAGQSIGTVHPNLRSLADLTFVETTPDVLAAADLVFLALPHGASAGLAARLPASTKVVDLGSDHRLTDPAAHERYYGGEYHDAWIYGLPELPGQRALIASADRVANTGCHAVAAILAIAPLVAAGLADPADVVVTSTSGTSGAGRSALVHLLGSEVMGDLTGYKVGAHRHVPEIKQASGATTLTMVPVLAPMPRGILSSVALRPTGAVTTESVHDALAAAYADEPFVHVLPPGQQPRTAATAGSNSAHLQAVVDADSGRIIVTSAIDNLGKGAAGQAVQLANLMLGLPETDGLCADGVAP